MNTNPQLKVEIPTKIDKDLEQKITKSIEEHLKIKDPDISFEVNEDLIGGIKIHMGSRVLDFSASGAFERARKGLPNG